MYKIDTDNKLVIDEKNNVTHPLGSKEGFKIISDIWLKSGWETKYVYSFAWMGRPVIQLPEDMIRIQEIIFNLKPDVIVETGIAHGGSLIFYASLCKAMEKGRIIGIDIEIRPHNRKAIEEHFLYKDYIQMVEGSSTAPEIVSDVKSRIKEGETVLVILDSNHTKQHVLDELNAYAPMVSVGSYIVATDGIMELVKGLDRTGDDWDWNNPKAAAIEFVAQNPDFIIEEPPFPFNESIVDERITYWPSCYIKKIK
ncbi:cephalosporin hydroxylase family protein [Ferruginibacter sp. HRS2-29]|uniref:cephalosporin hydroxylase family protein n=1 Tax=Ferruginibacter sp. HRS2-29 TaxID=2487334 RepID=UPI0020CE24A2|nr:CmcI family methyltransferase [Ferruginibacter sp. HRS2-29]MCP9749912.1 hydroxylase [Ferruginibacter sp. HRS2-29]